MRIIAPSIVAVGSLLVVLAGAREALRSATAQPTAIAHPLADVPRDDEITKQTIAVHCLSCHGEEMIEQQRLTPAQWKAEIEKMVSWGSALPAEEHAKVVDYLSRSFGPDSPPPLLQLVDGRGLAMGRLSPEEPTPRLLPGSSPERGGDLYSRHCANCHGPRGEGNELGPRLRNRPILAHPAEFVEVTSQGRRRMPASAGVLNVEQCHDIVSWLIRESRAELGD